MNAFLLSAVTAFDKAVQKELAVLAKKKVATVVLVDGKKIRAIPRKVNGRYVVRPTRK